MDILFFTHLLNALWMIGLPIGVGIYLAKRFHLTWNLWWIGGATFVLAQVGHIPFNYLLNWLGQQGIVPLPPAGSRLVINAIIAGLSAGLWEELSRYAAYRWWAKDARSWRKGIFLGAGHGGIEAILVGALTLYAFINLAGLRGVDLSTIVPPGQLALAQQQLAAYWNAPWSATLLGAVERTFTIVCQISLSVLVLQVFTRRKLYWLALAVFWHTLLDAIPVYLMAAWAGRSNQAYAVEGVIGIFALLSLGLIFLLRQPEPPAEPEPAVLATSEEPALPLGPVEIQITREKLDDSRYQ